MGGDTGIRRNEKPVCLDINLQCAVELRISHDGGGWRKHMADRCVLDVENLEE
jgi:hypothetical protein